MIGKDTIVSIRYRMTDGRDALLEESQTSFLHGSSAISPSLQRQLEGLTPGDRRLITLHKGEDDADADFNFDVIIDGVRAARPEELIAGHPLIPPGQAPPVQIHLLSGFLGSGKTTAIAQAVRFLANNGVPAAVITNDQGEHLVDGTFFEQMDIAARQVTNGCFCCRYDELDRCINSLTGQDRPAVLFAESVGSCADLVGTVLRPLFQHHPNHRLTLSVFADAALLPDMLEGRTTFDPAVRYIYEKQLEEAQVIVVSKSDRIADEDALHRLLADRYPGKIILFQNSFRSDHILRWLLTLEQASRASNTLSSPDINYDRYGAGEARLAWLDQELLIESPSQNAQSAVYFLLDRLNQCGLPIGHLKCLIDGTLKISCTATGMSDEISIYPAETASLLINARVQTTPAILSARMADAIQATEKAHRCTIRTLNAACFQPGFPRPTHRIP